jgi:hypothetical protein
LALLLFADSDAYLRTAGQQGKARAIAGVDDEIAKWLEDTGGPHSLGAMRREKAQKAVAWFAAVLGAELPEASLQAAADEIAGDDAAKARRYIDNFGIEDGLQKLDTVIREVLGSVDNVLDTQLKSILEAAGPSAEDSRAVATVRALNLLK